MAPRLQILSNVIERLKNINNNGLGYLYGIMHDNTITILTFNINAEDNTESEINHTILQLSMPAEVYLCGVLHIGELEEKLSDNFQDIDVTDNPLLLKYSPSDSSIKSYFYIHQKLEPENDIQVITEEDVLCQFVYIRLKGRLPLIAQNDNLIEVLEESRKDIASGKLGIHFPTKNTYLLEADDSKDTSLKEFLHLSGNCEGSVNTKKGNSHTPGYVDAIEANIILKMSSDKAMEQHIKYAPVIQHVKRTFNSLEGSVDVDALSLVNLNTTTSKLHLILVESVCRNIKLIEKYVEAQTENAAGNITLPIPIHFKPYGCGHLLTLAFQANKSDSETMTYRKRLHEVLGLDISRPCFRRGNAVQFSSDIGKDNLLINPHVAIVYNQELIKNSKVGIVQGLYAYHHYMQANFDDSGWGCAYRSLQTIISWYRLQGYTDISIPSHRTIQKCLVDIGDKPANFIGSKQWIGSTEVGFVLQSLLGVNVKFLCASTGEEVSTLVPNLIEHFERQGSPVMIGGGVLAHTILGASYNKNNEEVKFLILDPHYTGSDHLPTILSKGWCAWKSKDFWRKDAFYNMCLPERPLCI